MNDPYVVALRYRFVPEPTVDYSRAKPLNHEEEAFHLTVAGDEARFEMKRQYATKEAAQEAVEAVYPSMEVLRPPAARFSFL